jgi:hypothetical protein
VTETFLFLSSDPDFSGRSVSDIVFILICQYSDTNYVLLVCYSYFLVQAPDFGGISVLDIVADCNFDSVRAKN